MMVPGRGLLKSRFGTSDLFGVCDGLGGQLGVPRCAVRAGPLSKCGADDADPAACGAPLDVVEMFRQRFEQDRSCSCYSPSDDNDFWIENIDERSDRAGESSKRLFPKGGSLGIAQCASTS